MSKQVKMMIVVLGLLGILLGYNVWFFAKKKAGKARPRTTTTAVKQREPTKARSAAKNVPTVRYVSLPAIRDGWGERDPFVLPIEAKEGKPLTALPILDTEDDDALDKQLTTAAEAFVLQGILFDTRAPLAIIDNQLIRPGTRLDATFEVTEIRRDRVILSAEDQTFELSLPESKVKD